MKKYRIWLDDIRPIPEWMKTPDCIWYDTAEDVISILRRFINLFSLEEIEYISLDNDLGLRACKFPFLLVFIFTHQTLQQERECALSFSAMVGRRFYEQQL